MGRLAARLWMMAIEVLSSADPGRGGSGGQMKRLMILPAALPMRKKRVA